MFKFIILSTLAAMAMAQGNYNKDPRTAAIISEQRYLSGDGKFGAAYTQEDGINFKEETDSDGTRHGSYSYVDPNGQRRSISYTAGKNGFQASGDHLPVAPPAPPQVAPQPQYQPNPQYQPPAPQQQQYNHGGNNNFDDGSYDERYNDPSFSNGQQSHYQPAPAQAPAYHHAPAPAPAPAYHNAPQQQQQQHQQPASYNHNFQHQPSYNPPPPAYTTENPHRFQPPGKLSLNRTPDGFSYSFNKVK